MQPWRKKHCITGLFCVLSISKPEGTSWWSSKILYIRIEVSAGYYPRNLFLFASEKLWISTCCTCMLQYVFLHNLYCTFIALIFPFSQMISSLCSALLMMFVLCTRSFTDVMWCNVHPSVLLCVETDRCGDCLRMHTQLHCTQSLADSSLIFPISEFYIFSVTKLRRFQPSNCSLKLNFV